MNPKKVEMYACSKCSNVYIDINQAKECCVEYSICTTCGDTLEDGICRKCKYKEYLEQLRHLDYEEYSKKLSVIYDNEENMFHNSMTDFILYKESQNKPLPEYVFPCKYTKIQLDSEILPEWFIEDNIYHIMMINNPDIDWKCDIKDQIVNKDELIEFVSNWVNQQKVDILIPILNLVIPVKAY